jgi:enoyl-CoA hydratase/carnithine racemase
VKFDQTKQKEFPMTSEVVLYEKKGHTAFVTLNRPEAQNSYNDQSHGELVKIWRDVNSDDNVWAVVLTGAGSKAFCAGRDVKELAHYQKLDQKVPRYDPKSPTYKQFGHIWHFDLQKPVIGAINGFAIGGGLAFFLHCDLRVMSEDAWLADAHVNIGQLGGPEVVAQHMPYAIAAELVLMGGRITAQRAYEIGLVNKIVPSGQVLAEATKMAERICEMAPLAVQKCKHVMRTMYKATAGVQEMSDYYMSAMRETEDGVEGPRAFAEKRKPAWKAR